MKIVTRKLMLSVCLLGVVGLSSETALANAKPCQGIEKRDFEKCMMNYKKNQEMKAKEMEASKKNTAKEQRKKEMEKRRQEMQQSKKVTEPASVEVDKEKEKQMQKEKMDAGNK